MGDTNPEMHVEVVLTIAAGSWLEFNDAWLEVEMVPGVTMEEWTSYPKPGAGIGGGE